MKNLILCIVVISALVVAGIGGTLAGFSDTERSLDNLFEVGNLDLKVDIGGISGEFDDGVYTGTMGQSTGLAGVYPISQAFLGWPCTSQDFNFSLHNLSDNPQSGYLYMTFKDFSCYNVWTTKFPATQSPEPELVAQNGGVLANVNTPAMGVRGENCTLADFVDVVLFDTTDPTHPVLIFGDPNYGAGTVFLSDLVGANGVLWIPLAQVPGCTTKLYKISLHISNWSEEQWNERFDTSLAYFANDLPFNDWLTNLFMNDGVNFIMEFALTQDPIPAAYILNP